MKKDESPSSFHSNARYNAAMWLGAWKDRNERDFGYNVCLIAERDGLVVGCRIHGGDVAFTPIDHHADVDRVVVPSWGVEEFHKTIFPELERQRERIGPLLTAGVAPVFRRAVRPDDLVESYTVVEGNHVMVVRRGAERHLYASPVGYDLPVLAPHVDALPGFNYTPEMVRTVAAATVESKWFKRVEETPAWAKETVRERQDRLRNDMPDPRRVLEARLASSRMAADRQIVEGLVALVAERVERTPLRGLMLGVDIQLPWEVYPIEVVVGALQIISERWDCWMTEGGICVRYSFTKRNH